MKYFKGFIWTVWFYTKKSENKNLKENILLDVKKWFNNANAAIIYDYIIMYTNMKSNCFTTWKKENAVDKKCTHYRILTFKKYIT